MTCFAGKKPSHLSAHLSSLKSCLASFGLPCVSVADFETLAPSEAKFGSSPQISCVCSRRPLCGITGMEGEARKVEVTARCSGSASNHH